MSVIVRIRVEEKKGFSSESRVKKKEKGGVREEYKEGGEGE